MPGLKPIDTRPWHEAAARISDPHKRAELLYHLRLAEQAHEQALLEDMGYENCEVCRANRLRDAWEQP